MDAGSQSVVVLLGALQHARAEMEELRQELFGRARSAISSIEHSMNIATGDWSLWQNDQPRTFMGCVSIDLSVNLKKVGDLVEYSLRICWDRQQWLVLVDVAAYSDDHEGSRELHPLVERAAGTLTECIAAIQQGMGDLRKASGLLVGPGLSAGCP